MEKMVFRTFLVSHHSLFFSSLHFNVYVYKSNLMIIMFFYVYFSCYIFLFSMLVLRYSLSFFLFSHFASHSSSLLSLISIHSIFMYTYIILAHHTLISLQKKIVYYNRRRSNITSINKPPC